MTSWQTITFVSFAASYFLTKEAFMTYNYMWKTKQTVVVEEAWKVGYESEIFVLTGVQRTIVEYPGIILQRSKSTSEFHCRMHS